MDYSTIDFETFVNHFQNLIEDIKTFKNDSQVNILYFLNLRFPLPAQPQDIPSTLVKKRVPELALLPFYLNYSSSLVIWAYSSKGGK